MVDDNCVSCVGWIVRNFTSESESSTCRQHACVTPTQEQQTKVTGIIMSTTRTFVRSTSDASVNLRVSAPEGKRSHALMNSVDIHSRVISRTCMLVSGDCQHTNSDRHLCHATTSIDRPTEYAQLRRRVSADTKIHQLVETTFMRMEMGCSREKFTHKSYVYALASTAFG